MTKHEFLRELEEELAAASVEERVAAIQYYTEYLDEAGPEREGEVLAELGQAQGIAAGILAAGGTEEGWVPPPRGDAPKQGPAQPPEILPAVVLDAPVPYEAARPAYNKANNRIAKVIFLVLLALIFLPVVGGVGGVLLGLLIAALAVFAVPVFLGIGLCAGGVASCVAGVLMLVPTLGNGLVVLGMGFLLFGLGALSLHGGVHLLGRVLPCLARTVARLAGRLWSGLTSVISGGVQHG